MNLQLMIDVFEYSCTCSRLQLAHARRLSVIFAISCRQFRKATRGLPGQLHCIHVVVHHRYCVSVSAHLC